MDSSKFKDLIGQKRPRYKEQYRALIDSISKKGDTTGTGNFSSFGPYYQTYMYAFIIGYRLNKQNFIQSSEKNSDFVMLSAWNPTSIRDYIIMLLFNKSEEFGFKWIDLEDTDSDLIDAFIVELIRQMEGYANAGLDYLQNKCDNEKIEFQDPFVFVNILEELE